MVTEKEVIEKLKECFDPEIPINLYDLGLIYEVKIDGDEVYVKMTLTSMGCPVAPMIMEQVQEKAEELEGVRVAHVNLTWDPPWTPQKATEDGKTQLKYMGIPIGDH